MTSKSLEMTNEELIQVFDNKMGLDEFAKWVELTKLNNFKVSIGEACPIAKYAKSWYPKNSALISVGCTVMLTDDDLYLLPRWAEDFVTIYDYHFMGNDVVDYQGVLKVVDILKERQLNDQSE